MKNTSEYLSGMVSCVSLSQYLCLACVVLPNTSVYAATSLHGNQVIKSAVSYNNTTLDLSDARFTLENGGSLSVNNSTVNVTISEDNPFFVQIENGKLTLKNSKVNVKVNGILQTPNDKAKHQLINIKQGDVDIASNAFKVDTPFTVSLLETVGKPTAGFTINHNSIRGFHGGLYLVNSSSDEVNDNEFMNVSFSNIYNNGNLNQFDSNVFLFPGNLSSGNAFDLVDSEGVTIAHNLISSSAGNGISITGGNNIIIDDNKIMDGKSYAITINTPTLDTLHQDRYLVQLTHNMNHPLKPNNNIVITNNYFAQNKYGLTGGVINSLLVTNNVFIQRFTDTSIRQFWTNNDNLLPDVANLAWTDNLYKEAFTQDITGDNKPSLQFVSFPAHGGVFIN